MKARLDEAEAAVEKHLCINCGNPTMPLRSQIGVTGYTHDGGYGGWQGRRCPGRFTGAEPVQNPARVLREVEADRKLLEAWSLAEGDTESESAGGYADGLRRAVEIRALAYSDHPATTGRGGNCSPPGYTPAPVTRRSFSTLSAG